MTKVLTTDRFVLRPFRASDGDQFAYLGDSDWREYLTEFPNAETFTRNNLSADWTDELNYVIDDQGRVAGTVHLGIEKPNYVGELACLLRPSHWNAGIAVEVCSCVLTHAFTSTPLRKAVARCDAHHRRSWRVLEKLGMVREGILREQRPAGDGRYADEYCYGLLRAEWFAQLKPGSN